VFVFCYTITLDVTAGLGFCHAEKNTAKISEACGTSILSGEIMRKTHTPFGRFIQAHSSKFD
jgi:hypothetical protein